LFQRIFLLRVKISFRNAKIFEKTSIHCFGKFGATLKVFASIVEAIFGKMIEMECKVGFWRSVLHLVYYLKKRIKIRQKQQLRKSVFENRGRIFCLYRILGDKLAFVEKFGL
ncbi:MAG: hypothetical protein RMM53_10835, partial [Bacteroidia bacterium]|nr:hypothetical protein [Bacteroidia bacterium]